MLLGYNVEKSTKSTATSFLSVRFWQKEMHSFRFEEAEVSVVYEVIMVTILNM